MATSTFTLPVDVLSNLPNVERRASFSAAQKSTGVERAASPRLHYRHDQEAVEMSTLGDNLDPKSVSTVGIPEVSAWTMSPKKEWAAIITCCGCMFMNGWNDATTGPLLPIIQSHYSIGFIVVSMLFVSNCVGYLSAALVNIHLSDRLGFGKVTLLGSVLQILAYAVLAPTPPFPVMCISYAINGFVNFDTPGIGLQNAQANGFVTGIPNNTSAKLGLLHAGYGAGAFVAPLVATQFARLRKWSFHFLISLGISLINSLVLFFVFKLRRQHEIMGVPAPHSDNASVSRTDENAYKMVFGSRAVQLLAIFTWVYVGAEVTVGGWIVTFIIEERGGGASAGYVSSGFFGGGFFSISRIYASDYDCHVGLMLGRVLLLWIGERRVVYLYSVLAIGLELVIWLVPDIIGNALAVSFIGILLGPMYPIVMKVTSGLVPKRILTGCIGWIASSGQVGSAVFPFMTGALAQKYGVKVLQPMLVGMIGSLILLWTLVPAGPQRHRD
ncbi:Major Facilitator Superfamily, partial [Rhizoctonia solani]